MTSKFNRTLRLGYGFSVLILVVLGLFAYLTVQKLLTSNRAAAHSALVVQQLEKLLSVMKDAETGQRGYLLTGNPEFLEPYEGSYAQAINITDELGRLTANDAVQQHNVVAIRAILTGRLNKLQVLIDRKKSGESVSPVDLLAGKVAMDTLRRVVARSEADERRLLSRHNQVSEQYAGWISPLIVAAVLLGLLTAVYSYQNVVRDMREKDRLRAEVEEKEQETAAFNEELTAANEEVTAANEELTAINEELSEARDELANANETLEQRVEERTRALQNSEQETAALNEELSALNEELAASNEELLATNEELAAHERRLQTLVDELVIAEEKSAKLAAIVESSDDAIISKDFDGTIISWNQGAERMYGYSPEEIVGRSVLTLIPEELHHEEPVILERLRNGERLEHLETRRLTSEGKLIDVSLTISPVRDKQGKLIGISKIARDITEQKLAEQRKSDFIGIASHELKTPLTSLSGLVQVLEQRFRNGDDTVASSLLIKAVRQTRRMASLINGFLNVSRLEAGQLVLDKQDFDLPALIAEQIEELRLAVSSHKFIVRSCDELSVHADREKIGSVISNLLSNAVKYSPRARTVTISCDRKDGEAIVSVKDEGMGVKPQDLPKIFDRYYRVESEHTRHISGFGVGLYLCAEIVKLHNGRIWAESEKGVGSSFSFSLPLA